MAATTDDALELGVFGAPTVVIDDEIKIRDIMYLSISLDHRVVDGANAARFMNTVVKYLEDPQLFLLEGI